MRTGAGLAAALAWAVAAAAGALVLALAAGAGSPVIGAALVMLVAVGAWLAWGGQPRRLLIAALYFVAPIDVSKAILPPLDRFFSPGFYLSLGHAVLLLLTLLWAGHRLLIERRALPFTRLDALALTYFAWMFARSLGTLQGALATASALQYGLAVLGFYVVSHAVDNLADLRLALRAVVAGVLAELLFVVAQMATRSPVALPGAKVMSGSETLFFGGAGEAFRPNGFFIHPNSLADHMTLVIPAALALVLLGRRRLAARVWWLALIVLAAASAMLLATLSRGGWAAIVPGGAWVVWRLLRHGLLKRRQLALMALAGVVAGVAVVAVYPQLLLRLTAPDDRSTESRLLLTDQALTIIHAHPWIGVGYGGYNRAAYEYIAPAFANVSHAYQEALLQLVVHDHYLLVAAEMGVPAMAFFVYLLYRMIMQPRPWAGWRDPSAFALAVGLSGGLVAQLLFLASDNFYADIRLFMIWLTAGTLQSLCLQQRALRLPVEAGQPALADATEPRQAVA